MTPSTLTVDLDADGRQHGFVLLDDPAAPFERERRVPFTVLRRGEGPRLALVADAGVEAPGADAVGPLALQRLARELDPDALRGTVVIVPHLPPAALQAFGRQVLDRASTVIELAASPTGLAFAPVAAIRSDVDGETRARAEATMIAFGAPDSARLDPALAGNALDGVLDEAVVRVRATLGGVALPRDALDIALDGCRNALVAGGALDAPFTLRATRMLEVRDAGAVVRAPTGGLLEPCVRPGHPVYRGNPLARLVDPSRSGAEPLAIAAPRDGIVLAARRDARVSAGDALAVLAEEVAR